VRLDRLRSVDHHRDRDGRDPISKKDLNLMATIGTFTRTDNGFTGSVKTLTLNVKSVKFVPAEGDTDNGPDYRVLASNVDYAETVIMRSVGR